MDPQDLQIAIAALCCSAAIAIPAAAVVAGIARWILTRILTR